MRPAKFSEEARGSEAVERDRLFGFEASSLKKPGTAVWPVPGVRSIRAVRQYQRNALRPGQARAIGMATNFVASSDFNRINTVRLPFLWASLMALRTSAGVVTFFP